MRENIATVPAIPRRTLITLTMIFGIVDISTLPALRSSDASQRIFSVLVSLFDRDFLGCAVEVAVLEGIFDVVVFVTQLSVGLIFWDSAADRDSAVSSHVTGSYAGLDDGA